MATKTKAELLKEIEVKNDEIKDLKNEVAKLERYKQYEAMTDELAAMRDSFVNSGFTKAEALELVKQIIATAVYQQTGVKQAAASYRYYR